MYTSVCNSRFVFAGNVIGKLRCTKLSSLNGKIPKKTFKRILTQKLSVYVFLGVLTLLSTSSLCLSGDQVFSVRSQEKFGQNAVGSVDWDSDSCPIFSVLDYLLNVEAPSSSVDSGDLSFGSLEASSYDLDGVFSSYRKGSDSVLLFQFFGNVSTHKFVSEVGRGVKVCDSGFSSRA